MVRSCEKRKGDRSNEDDEDDDNVGTEMLNENKLSLNSRRELTWYNQYS